jgi:hypothetical protein
MSVITTTPEKSATFKTISFGPRASEYDSPRRALSTGTIAASVTSISVRQAGRVNALSVSDREHADLLQERAALLKQKMSAPLSQRQADRLEYVRWSLDRIEDARHGHQLDRLEALVSAYQDAIRHVQQLNADLSGYLPSKK